MKMSNAPSEKESKGPKKPSRMWVQDNSVDWKTFVWNPATNEFMGRNALSWAKILGFYIVFYAFLACYFAIMMIVFYHTLEEDAPKYTSKHGTGAILQIPGLSMRPNTPRWLVYNEDLPKSYQEILHNINNLTEVYNRIRTEEKHHDCSSSKIEPCDFNISIIDHSEMASNSWGYSTASPTFLLKINKIFDWTPEVYNWTELPVELREELVNIYSIDQQEMIYLWCTSPGRKFTYVPYPGFPVYYFPFNNQRGFLAPMVAVKIHNLPYEEVPVKCSAYTNKKKVNIKFTFVRTNQTDLWT